MYKLNPPLTNLANYISSSIVINMLHLVFISRYHLSIVCIYEIIAGTLMLPCAHLSLI